MARKCLHCALIETVNEWSIEVEASGQNVNRVETMVSVTRFVADLAVALTEPGKDRADCLNSFGLGLALVMSKRINELAPTEEDQSPTAPDGVVRH